MITISQRDAHIGTAIPFRTQYHGEDHVAGADVPISAVLLDPAELNMLLQEPLAHRSLFAKRAGSTLDDPLFKGLKPLQLTDKIEGANVCLFVGIERRAIDLGTCKLKNITLEPKTGGLTELSCTVQTTPTLDKRIAILLEHMDAGAQIEIGYEHNAQQGELPMGANVVVNGNGAHEEGAAFEAAAKEQVAAFKRGRAKKAARKGAH